MWVVFAFLSFLADHLTIVLGPEKKQRPFPFSNRYTTNQNFLVTDQNHICVVVFREFHLAISKQSRNAMFDDDKLPSAIWVISSMKSGRQLAWYNLSTRFRINSWLVSCAKQFLTNGLFQILSSSSSSEWEDSDEETEMSLSTNVRDTLMTYQSYGKIVVSQCNR